MIEVEVPNVGVVEFPDEMSPEQIQRTLAKSYGPNQEDQWPPKPTTLTPGQIYLNELAGGLKKITTEPLTAAKEAISGVFGDVSQVAADKLRSTGIDPSAEAGKPIAPIDRIPLEVMMPGTGPIPSLIGKIAPNVAEGVEEGAGETVAGFTEPGQAAMLPLASLKPVQALFATQGALQIPESIKAIYESKDNKERAKAIFGLGANALMTGAMGYHLAKGPIGKLIPTPEREQANASQITPPAKVYGDVRPQQPPAIPLPTEESGPGVQPQAQGVAQETQVPLIPKITGNAEQGYTISLGDKAESGFESLAEAKIAADEIRTGKRKLQPGEPVKPEPEQSKETSKVSDEEELLAELNAQERQALDFGKEKGADISMAGEGLEGSNPFAADDDQSIATITPDRRIIINRKAFNRWLMDIPEDQQAEAIKSMVDEEHIHLKTDAADALGYWNSLNRFEKALVRRRYTGKWGKSSRFNDTQLGFEAVRGRIQQLSGMTPREIAEAVGRERWTTQTVYTLEKAIAGIKENLGTDASKTQLDILNRVQNNLNIAKQAISGGAQPQAYRKGSPEESAAEFGLRFKPAGAVNMEGVPPELAEQLNAINQKNGWEFTDRRPNSITSGMTFYSPVGADHATIQERFQQTTAKFLGLPEVPDEHIRLYHGEGGPEGAGMYSQWFSTDPNRAASYGGRVSYVDIPKSVAEYTSKLAQKSGSGTSGDHILPDEWSNKAKDAGELEVRAHEMPAAYRKETNPQDEPYNKVDLARIARKTGDWDRWKDMDLTFGSALFKHDKVWKELDSIPEADQWQVYMSNPRWVNSRSPRVRTLLDKFKKAERDLYREKMVKDLGQLGGFSTAERLSLAIKYSMPDPKNSLQGLLEKFPDYDLNGLATTEDKYWDIPVIDKEKILRALNGTTENSPRLEIIRSYIEGFASGHSKNAFKDFKEDDFYDEQLTPSNEIKKLDKLYDKVSKWIDERSESQGRFPFAHRKGKGKEGIEQLKFFGGVTAKGEPGLVPGEVERGTKGTTGAVPVPPEDIGTAFLKEPVAKEIEAIADTNLKSATPSFTDLMEQLKKVYGPNIKNHQVQNLFEDRLWPNLLNASGQRLAELVESLGLQSKLQSFQAREAGYTIKDIPDAPMEQAEQLFRDITGRAASSVTKQEPSIPGLMEQVPEKEKVSRQDLKEIRTNREKGQRFRSKVISVIAQKLLEEAMPERDRELNRNLAPDDINLAEDISPELAQNPKKLEELLKSESRRSNKDPVNVTKRLVVLRNRKTGSVEVADVYVRGKEGPMVMRGGVGGINVQHGKLSEVMGSHVPIYTILLHSPVKDFFKRFKSMADFNEAFNLKEALERGKQGEYGEYFGEGTGELGAPENRPAGAFEEGEEAPEGTRPQDVESEEELSGQRLGQSQVTEGEGGMFMGPESEMGRALLGVGRSLIRRSQRMPMTPGEAKSLLSVGAEMEVSEPSDLGVVLDIIKQSTRNRKISGRYFQFLSALDKAVTQTFHNEKVNRAQMRELARKFKGIEQQPIPDVTEREAYEIALKNIFNAVNGSENERDFIQQILGKYGRETGRAAGPAALPQKPQTAKVQGVVRDLTMRSRVPPTTLRPEHLPPDMPPIQRRPAPGIPEASPGTVDKPEMLPDTVQARNEEVRQASLDLRRAEQGEVPTEPFKTPSGKGTVAFYTKAPAFFIPRTRTMGPEMHQRLPEAFRKVKQATADEYIKNLRAIKAAVKRSSVVSDIFRTMDGMENMAKAAGSNAGKAVLVASSEDLSPGLIDKWGVPFSKEYRAKQSEASNRRAAARAVIATTTVDQNGNRVWSRSKLRIFRSLVNEGIRKSERLMNSGGMNERRKGRAWNEAAKKLLREIDYADANWKDPLLKNTALAAQSELHDQIVFENANGSNIKFHEGYLPGRYESDFFDDDSVSFGQGRRLGGKYRLPKKFDNYYTAISQDAYIPSSYDVADLVQHRVSQGMRMVGRRSWLSSWTGVNDPHSGKPVAISADPIFVHRNYTDPTTGVTVSVPTIEGWKSPDPSYEVVYSGSGKQQAIAVREGYRRAVAGALGHSEIMDSPVGQAALYASRALKHGVILILDTFHPGRLGQYAAALGGKEWFDYRFGYQGGISALTYRAKDIPEAVKKGLVSPRAADWAMGTVIVNHAGKKVPWTRHEIAQAMIERGLNAAKISDALQTDAVKSIPLIGQIWNGVLHPFNKMVFDRITPGLMIESAVTNFERLNQSHPNVPIESLIKDVNRDINAMYGNMGRQGVFRNPTWKALSETVLLAPFWLEGLVQKEARFYSRASGASWLAGRGRTMDIPGLPKGSGEAPYMGALGRGMMKGLAAYFVLTQMVNLITRRQFTWDNKEDGHKMDAWIPTGMDEHTGEHTGFWVSPMSVFAETLHDYIRLGETKHTAWEKISQIGANKLGPIGRIARILFSNETPQGYKITSTAGVAKAAAGQLFSGPISLSPAARLAGHAVAPTLVSPSRPGEFSQRMFTSMGVKSELARSLSQQMQTKALKFVEENHLKPDTGWQQVMTDEPSYSKLRSAVRNGDEAMAIKMLNGLRKTRNDAQILKSMRLSSTRPLTGSRVNETLFLYSLTPDEMEQYHQAMMNRMVNYQTFLSWYSKLH